MNISVVLALPDVQHVMKLDVAPDCTARRAVWLAVDAGLDSAADQIDIGKAPLGVYGQRVDDDTVLSEGDRVEIYRPLQQDPMELRRQRAASESIRTSARRK